MSKKPNKKKVKAVRVWMVDLIGGYVDVVEFGIYIKFPNIAEKLWYGLDNFELSEALKGINEKGRGVITRGKLTFYGHNLGEKGEAELVIEPSDEIQMDFSFEVGLSEFRTALISK